MDIQTYITHLIYGSPIEKELTGDSIKTIEGRWALDSETFNWLKYQSFWSYRWFEETDEGYREIRVQWYLDDLYHSIRLNFDVLQYSAKPEWLTQAINDPKLTQLFDTRKVI